jgi:hypothetical protein
VEGGACLKVWDFGWWIDLVLYRVITGLCQSRGDWQVLVSS